MKELSIEEKAKAHDDVNRFRNLIYLVEHSNENKPTKEGFIKFINKLKSLRPQTTWKPSNEQMKALHRLNLTGNISYAGQGQTLIELYNDLKKLKGE